MPIESVRQDTVERPTQAAALDRSRADLRHNAVPATYVVSPLLTVRPPGEQQPLQIFAGTGFERQRLSIKGGNAEPLLTWILGRTDAATAIEHSASVRETVGIPAGAADDLVEQLIAGQVLIELQRSAPAAKHLDAWTRYGWQDAATFHAATFGQRFDPDTVEGVGYQDHFTELLNNPGPVGAQPGPTKATDAFGPTLALHAAPRPAIDVQTVLQRCSPINGFIGEPASAREILGVLHEAFGVQRTVNGTLGTHLAKAYPSGGARHPLECYLVAKTVDGIERGLYHYDPLEYAIRRVQVDNAAECIDAACVNKGGIVSASAVIVLTCRWLRHNWKYRYPRSYRMVLLELGHAVQAFNTVTCAYGLRAYHCPSILDDQLRALLALDDDCAEGPLYAIGIGRGGMR